MSRPIVQTLNKKRNRTPFSWLFNSSLIFVWFYRFYTYRWFLIRFSWFYFFNYNWDWSPFLPFFNQLLPIVSISWPNSVFVLFIFRRHWRLHCTTNDPDAVYTVTRGSLWCYHGLNNARTVSHYRKHKTSIRDQVRKFLTVYLKKL